MRQRWIFDLKARNLADIFCAVRIAELGNKGIYNTEIHDPWFANFGENPSPMTSCCWCRAIIALGAADQVAADGLRSLSRLLSSGGPRCRSGQVQPHNNPAPPHEAGPRHFAPSWVTSARAPPGGGTNPRRHVTSICWRASKPLSKAHATTCM